LAKNFDKLGIAEYDVISSSLDMNKGKQPFRDDAVVVKLFCERMLNLLRSDKQIRDNGIQRMPTAVLAADTAVGAVIGVEPMPPSLLLLQRQIEDVVAAACDGDSVTDVVANQNLTHYTREFIQSSWDGSMWESRFGRKVPLACAVHCLETVLEEVSTKILKVGGVFHMNMDLNFRKCCRMTFKVCERIATLLAV
jgi:hypothetical protein